MEEQHPIKGLMVTAMNSIKQMIDVNTIIGDPIKALDNTVIIPISKVGFGFAAGGSEFTGETVNSYNRREKEENIKYRLPFGGGSGAGVNITPVAFLIVQNDTVKLIEANHSSVLDKLVEYVPDVIEKVNKLFSKKIDSEELNDEYNEENEEDDNDLDWDDDFYEEDDEVNANSNVNSDLESDDLELDNENDENSNTTSNKKIIKSVNDNYKREDTQGFRNSKRSKFEKTIKEVKNEDDE